MFSAILNNTITSRIMFMFPIYHSQWNPTETTISATGQWYLPANIDKFFVQYWYDPLWSNRHISHHVPANIYYSIYATSVNSMQHNIPLWTTVWY